MMELRFKSNTVMCVFTNQSKIKWSACMDHWVLYGYWCVHSNSTVAVVFGGGIEFDDLIMHLYDKILRVVLIRIVLPGQQVSLCMYEYMERTRLLFENQHISKVRVFCVWIKRNKAKKCCFYKIPPRPYYIIKITFSSHSDFL